MNDYILNNFLIVAGSKHSIKKEGITQDHAYSILGCKKVGVNCLF